MDIVNPRVKNYMRGLLARYNEPVLLEMEAEAERIGFPIIGRLVGVTVELLARSVGAKRVFELGSGYGYSAYWFSRAVGDGGELHCTDGDLANEQTALGYLSRAELAGPIRWHVGDALDSLAATHGDFDIVFVDIDKHEYPDAWRAASERVRVGGMYLADNVLGTGSTNVLRQDDVANAIREHNRLIAEDERYVSVIVPTREGLIVALRIAR